MKASNACAIHLSRGCRRHKHRHWELLPGSLLQAAQLGGLEIKFEHGLKESPYRRESTFMFRQFETPRPAPGFAVLKSAIANISSLD